MKRKDFFNSSILCISNINLLVKSRENMILFKVFRYLSLIIILVLTSPFSAANGQEIGEFFKKNCFSCHTIGGGKLIGPDLKNVTERQDREWLINFILDPLGVLKSGDPYALKLQADANGVVMSPIFDITQEQAGLLLDLIESESKLEISQFIGKMVLGDSAEAPDPIFGNRLFTGEIQLHNGAPSCISCHSGAGPNIGGGLGPNLSYVLERLQGRRALAAWLSSPPTSTMKSVFKKRPLQPDEIRVLVDLFESWNELDRRYNYDPFMVWMSVIFYGFGGTVLILLIFSGFWHGRFRSVRRPLIDKAKLRGKLG